MLWKVESIPELAGYTIEWAEPNNYYLSRKDVIFHSEDLKTPFRRISRIDNPFWQRAASMIRPGQRLLRFLVYNLLPLANGDIFVTFGKKVGLIRNGRYIELPGLARPCRVLRAGCAVDAEGDVYFGEYLDNADRGPMRIYRLPANGDRLEIAHTFPSGAIRHVHGMYFDELSGSVYCLTGDAGAECRIMRSSDGFRSIDIIGEGAESWRAVSLLFDTDSIYYGTDAEFEANRVFRLDRKTARRDQLGKVSGTVFYSKKIGSDLFFTTTAENAPSQTENVAALWNVDQEGNFTQVAKFEKDRWPGGLLMFGTIHFPFVNRFDDRLFFSLVGVEGDDQTFRLIRPFSAI